MPYWILERKLEKKGKDEISMSEIGHPMYHKRTLFYVRFLII